MAAAEAPSLIRRPPSSLVPRSVRPAPQSGVFQRVAPKVGKSILVVDPDPGVRGGVVSALASRFTIHEAADGATALEVARAILPALIVTELAMPGLDGLALVRMMKMQPALRGVPFVVLSSRNSPQDIARAVAAGARRYLIKPCVPDSLVEIAERIVQR